MSLPSSSLSTRRVCYIIAFLLLVPSNALAADEPSFSGTTHFHSQGTAEAIVFARGTGRLRWSYFADDANLSSPGRYAALLIEELDVPWEVKPTVLFHKTLFGACSKLQCDQQEIDQPLVKRTEDPHGTMSLHPGRYRVVLFADGGATVTATVSVDGLIGETSVELIDSTTYSAEMLPVTVTETTTSPLMEGGATEAALSKPLVRSGAVLLTAWWVSDLGRFEFRGDCIGMHGSSRFDERGYCLTSGMQAKRRGSGELHLRASELGGAGVCWSHYWPEDCGVGDVRVGFRVELESVSQAVGGIGFWLPFGWTE